jgi:hypothetical protein
MQANNVYCSVREIYIFNFFQISSVFVVLLVSQIMLRVCHNYFKVNNTVF